MYVYGEDFDLTPLDCATMTRSIARQMMEAERQAVEAVKHMTFHDYLIWHAVSGPLVWSN